jgi:hypothetical protein
LTYYGITSITSIPTKKIKKTPLTLKTPIGTPKIA